MNDSTHRGIPSVDSVLQNLRGSELPRRLLVDVIRSELAEIRSTAETPSREMILNRVRQAVRRTEATRLQPVLNATGISLHTNFGRAPISHKALQWATDIAGAYSNLEYDTMKGERGHRGEYVERCLALLCEAEAAMVVNNCAAALVLILRHFTNSKREVIISRGELIQIGGGFRIPEIMESTGAILREVGTTNRTVTADYEQVIGPATGLILKVHRSNFFMDGFVGAPMRWELSELATSAGVPFVEDLGSGAVADTSKLATMAHEPSPAEALRQGVGLVCFSGDKLFGGPQAGIIVGQAALIEALRRNPLFRAVRCDKLILASLQATVETYLAGVEEELPTLEILSTTQNELHVRATSMAHLLQDLPVLVQVIAVDSQVGGGALPRLRPPSAALGLKPKTGSLEGLAEKLRSGRPPVIGYIAHNQLVLDLRTILPTQDALFAQMIRQALLAS